MTRLRVHDPIPDFVATTARGSTITTQDLRGTPTLLQFHRFAACPACFLSVREFDRRYQELRDEGLRLVAFFYSTTEQLADSFKELAPEFDIVGDPDRKIFDRFGVERSVRKFLTLRAWTAAVVGWSKGAKFDPVSNLTKEDTAGVPADFLINSEGIIQHVHYGAHAADSMTVDAVLTTHRSRPTHS